MPGSACKTLHPGRTSGPCKVCQQHKDRYWHLDQALPHHNQLVKNLREKGLSDTDCVCQSCQKRYAKPLEGQHSTSEKSEKRPLERECAVSQCCNSSNLHQTNLFSFSQEVLNSCGLQFDSASASPSAVFATLCHKHYCQIYTKAQLQSCTLCLSAHTSLILCNNIKAAQEYATHILQDVEKSALSDYNLCRHCYGAVYRFSKGQQYLNSQRSDITYFSSLLTPFQGVEEGSVDDVAFAKSILSIGHELSNDRPMLLQAAYDVYLSNLNEKNPNLLDLGTKRSFYSYVNSVKAALGECIILSVIPHKPRLGTMIRRYGTDVVSVLHILLYAQSQQVDTETHATTDALNKQKSGRAISLGFVADLINKNITSTAKKIIAGDKQSLKLDDFDFLSEIQRIDPLVWNFVVACTMGPNEDSQIFLSGNFDWEVHYLGPTHRSDAVNRSKFLKRFFLTCSLLYASNENCFTHLHMALSDIIDRFTGSSTTCFDLLSKFGLTVSKSTYLRFQTSVTKEEMTKKPSILSRSFCVASVDNIDRSATYATVRAGQANRGFHGTSVQAVEPLPLSLREKQAMQLAPTSTRIGRVDSHSNLKSSEVAAYHSASTSLATCNPLSLSSQPNVFRQSLSIDDFSLSEAESTSLAIFEKKVFYYMMVKHVCHTKLPDLNLPPIKVCFSDPAVSVEQSHIHFTSVLAEPADSQETMLTVLDLLHEKHQVGNATEHLVVVGDAKTYSILHSLKKLYGDELNWMIPYLGEWHLLKNSQPPLMKVYLDAGLKDLLSLFHKGATLKAVSNASGFQKSHQFLMQVWEAFYRHLLKPFYDFECADSNNEVNPLFAFTEDVFAELQSNGTNFFPQAWDGQLFSNIDVVFNSFKSFAATHCARDSTFKFWYGFVSRDMMSYAALYMAIRSRNFDLRSASIRQFAPLFHALDRPYYLKFVPLHIATLKICPHEILENLQKGAFAVSITGGNTQCVALDEAHEMAINKEVKMAMNATDIEGLSRLVHYLPYRSRVVKNISSQVYNPNSHSEYNDNAAMSKEVEVNVRSYLIKLSQSIILFNTASQSPLLSHIFSNEVASEHVTNDLLNFYCTGEQDFQSYVKSFILGDTSSVRLTRHKRNLHTFTKKKATKQKKQQELKDHKLQIACLRKQIAWSQSNSVPVPGFAQFMPLPRAICDCNGIPYKGNKAVSSSFFQARYPQAFVEDGNLFPSSSSICVILEGMFLINTTRPLDGHKNFGDYASFLYSQWVGKAVRAFNAAEVHIIFDDPGRHGPMPKDIERSRRDESTQLDEDETSYTVITPLTSKPPNWTKFIKNRRNKRLLVTFLSHHILHLAGTAQYCPKRVVTSGGFDGDERDKTFQFLDGTVSQHPLLTSNHEEGDSRVWFHAFHTECKNILIYSPDRDIFNIGLPLMSNHFLGKQVFVQLRRQYGNDLYLSMNTLTDCLLKDFDLQSLGEKLFLAPSFVQMLFISSGCDYVSFFKGHTKTAFLKTFFRYAKFITGGIYDGLLSQGNLHEIDQGLLSFYRLIGSVYFQAHAGAFSEQSPEELFHCFRSPEVSILEQHIAFVSKVRSAHFHRISDESQWMPSATALKYHWLRSCWTMQLWSQACNAQVVIPPLSDYGWELSASLKEMVNHMKWVCIMKGIGINE
ncbi:hypothetical protein HOLleu_06401 [Holothuria leucospilota]|uniref:Uncharacterized protein n=1 Tax=Holothuria leucospilota TaxID=206669 RepID=A0A9Q1HF50_HOLLE|nr:hypothetical protein HOLleu_06401 [Holothuria leucospilota]